MALIKFQLDNNLRDHSVPRRENLAAASVERCEKSEASRRFGISASKGLEAGAKAHVKGVSNNLGCRSRQVKLLAPAASAQQHDFLALRAASLSEPREIDSRREIRGVPDELVLTGGKSGVQKLGDKAALGVEDAERG